MFFLPPILGYAIMALATFFVASAIWSVIKHRTEYSALKAALACVAALYPLGLGAKVAGFGSEFLRWHVADIGFPVIIGYGVLLHLATNRHGYTWRIAQKLMVVALMMCYAYEVAAGQLTRFAQHNQLIGSFDWVDSNVLRRAVETVFAMDIKTFTDRLLNYLYDHQKNPAIRQYTPSVGLDHCDSLSLKERRTTEGYSVSTAIRYEQVASKSIAVHLLTLDSQEREAEKRSSTLDALVIENRELREENMLLHSKLEKVAAILSTALNDTLRL